MSEPPCFKCPSPRGDGRIRPSSDQVSHRRQRVCPQPHADFRDRSLRRTGTRCLGSIKGLSGSFSGIEGFESTNTQALTSAFDTTFSACWGT